MSIFGGIVFFWWKITFYAKSVSFWANEWISKFIDKIISRKLWGKVTSVSVNINFGAKVSILCEKNWNFGRNVDFFIKCALILKVIIFLQNILIFRKMWLLVWRFIYINKVSNSDKILQFHRYVNLHMCKLSFKYFICWKIVILIQNMILFSDILGKCDFPSKIYITLDINSWEKLSNFLRKVLI